MPSTRDSHAIGCMSAGPNLVARLLTCLGSGAPGSEAGDYLVVGPDWKGETPAGIKNVFRSSAQPSPAAPAISFPKIDKEP